MDLGVKATRQCAQGDLMDLNEEARIRSAVLRLELDFAVPIIDLFLTCNTISKLKKEITLEAQRIFGYFVSKYRCSFTHSEL